MTALVVIMAVSLVVNVVLVIDVLYYRNKSHAESTFQPEHDERKHESAVRREDDERRNESLKEC